jgi:ketosteroid isomerase-like protein
MKMTTLFGKFLFVWVVLSCQTGFAQTSPDQTAGLSITPNEKIVRTVYAAYEKKDWNMLTSVLAEGFTFSSPVNVPPIDIKEYKGKCWPNSANIKKFHIDKLMVDGDNVFVSYHCWTLNGKVLWNTEYFTLKDGKIKEFVCFFGPGVGYPNNTGK